MKLNLYHETTNQTKTCPDGVYELAYYIYLTQAINHVKCFQSSIDYSRER